VIDEAEFLGREPALDTDSVDTACTLYLGSEEFDEGPSFDEEPAAA
jgi:hypothetical protein